MKLKVFLSFCNFVMMYDTVHVAFNSPWLYYCLAGFYAFTIVVILCVVISENRNPVKSLAWVTVLMLLPVVGIVLYIFFGRSIKNTRMISRRDRKKLKRLERMRPIDIRKLDVSEATRQQIRLARSLTGTYYFPDNDIEIFTNGHDKFERLFADIATARTTINIQYYIFEDDMVGGRLSDLLIEKARAGVKVRLIYDHVGSFHVKNKFFKRLRNAGVEAYPFFKVTFPLLGYRINWRNHRKIVVIDGRIAYIGGMNVADRYIDGGKFGTWRDTHLRICGPGVASLEYSFAVDWNFMGQPLIEHDPKTSREPCGSDGIQLVTSGPTNQWSNIEMMFHRAIANARERVFIQTPYFLPTEGLFKALVTAAMANVDVRIMLPRYTDSSILRYASASYVTACLRAGIKIYFYEPGMLHSKVLIIDDEMTSVGSTNFDFRSFEHNFEANIFIYSREFNRRMSDIFAADQRHSTRILPAEWKRRPRRRKIAESVLRLLSPIL